MPFSRHPSSWLLARRSNHPTCSWRSSPIWGWTTIRISSRFRSRGSRESVGLSTKSGWHRRPTVWMYACPRRWMIITVHKKKNISNYCHELVTAVCFSVGIDYAIILARLCLLFKFMSTHTVTENVVYYYNFLLVPPPLKVGLFMSLSEVKVADFEALATTRTQLMRIITNQSKKKF